jgi:hypothetical protein
LSGPVFQAAEGLQLQALFSLARASDYASLYSPKVPADRTEAGALLAAAWSISRQWDLGLRAGATWLGNANGYRERWASLLVTEFW